MIAASPMESINCSFYYFCGGEKKTALPWLLLNELLSHMNSWVIAILVDYK